MLQRQMMLKQLQELQRKQQLEELGNNGSQNYVHQLSSVKQASGVQYSPPVNETSVEDSPRICTYGKTQTMQHNRPNCLLPSQNHDLALQFDVSSYGIHAPNADESLNQYSQLQGPSNLPVNLLTKNQSTFDGSFMSQRYNFSSDQISRPDGSIVSNQENNLFGQVRAGGFNNGILSGNYPQQGFTRHKNASFLESENWDNNGASLDPLEQKILYNTDDNSWESAFSRIGKMNSGGFKKTVEMPSMQSGSWSALMQSAAAESSSSDAGIQEEWSGLSFQNPEPLNDGGKLQNDWVDRNLQNASSPSSRPEDMVQNINSFTNFQKSAQYFKQEKENQPTRGSHRIQESLSSANICPGELKEHSNNDAHHPSNNFSGHEFRGTFCSQGSTSDHVSCMQKNYNQVNQLNNHGYSVKPESMDPVGVSDGESVTASRENMFELLNKDDNNQTSAVQLSSKASIPRNLPSTSSVSPDFLFRMGPTNPQIPQSYSSFPPDMLKHAGFPMGLPTPWSENLNSFPNEYQQLEKGNSLREDSIEINNSTSPSRNTNNEHEFKREHNMEANAVESKEVSSQVDVKKETLPFPDRDIGPFRHPSNQNYSPLHRVLSARNDETDGVKNFPPENDNVNNQQSIANARKLLLSGLQSGVHDRGNWDLHALSQLGAFWSGKPSSTSHNQNFQNITPNRSTSSNDTSNLTYQSHIRSQMASSWFKHYETLKNGQILPMYDARAQNNAPHPFDEMTRGKLRENSLITQANLANASQGSGLYPSTASASIVCKQLNPACVLPLDVTCQNMAVSMPKKRTFSVLDMVPWHKEVHCGKSRVQDISTAEYLWAEVSNSKPEEANNEADIVEEMLPMSRAKRRLISTTQLMQQVFRPAPVIILCSDASPNFDCVPYFAARLALGDAWSLTYTNNMSFDELKSSKRTKGCKFSKVVEAFIDRMKKVEAALSGLDKSLSFVDIKVESRELEKFSTINRFAKFHLRAQPVNVDPASSSGPTTLPKGKLQRYVVPLPMPKIVPEGQECLSL